METHNPPDRFIRVGALKVRYWMLGDQGTPLLLLHGIGSSVEFWQKTIHELAGSQRVIAVDLPGHGYTDRPDARYDFAYYAGFIGQLMGALKLKKVNLLGHSIGGGAALSFAAAHPGKVQRLILVDSVGLGSRLQLFFRLPTLPVLGEVLARPSRSQIKRILEICVKDTPLVTDELVDYYHGLASQPGAGRVFLKTMRAIATLGGIRKRIVTSMQAAMAEVGVPTLIIWGLHDRVLPLGQALHAKELLPNASAFFIEGSGHFPPLEKPDVFTEVVLKFLENASYYSNRSNSGKIAARL